MAAGLEPRWAPEAAGMEAAGVRLPPLRSLPHLCWASRASLAPLHPAGPLMGHATRLATPPGALGCLAFSPPSASFPSLIFVHVACRRCAAQIA